MYLDAEASRSSGYRCQSADFHVVPSRSRCCGFNGLNNEEVTSIAKTIEQMSELMGTTTKSDEESPGISALVAGVIQESSDYVMCVSEGWS